MCIAIYNPNNVTLKKKVLKNCWDNNTDGAGMLYIANGVLKAHKEMTNFDNFYKFYQSVRRSHHSSNIVLHFRISTHGKINETNCHPFLVNDKVGFVHNGVIYNSPSSKDFSDTYMFNEHILQKLPADFVNNDAMMELISEYIGTGSKLIFLDDTNQAHIVNEKAGVWDMNCWFSNTTYKYSGYYDYGGVSMPRSGYSYGGSSKGAFAGYDYDYNKATGSWERKSPVITPSSWESNKWSALNSVPYKCECDACGSIKQCKDDFDSMGTYCEGCYDKYLVPLRSVAEDNDDFVF